MRSRTTARNYVVDAAEVRVAASPASRRARPARSTTGGSCRGRGVRARRAARLGRAARRRRPLGSAVATRAGATQPLHPRLTVLATGARAAPAARPGATVPPWSASHPHVNLYTQRDAGHRHRRRQLSASPTATCESDTHHIVLDFGADAVPGARRPVDRHPAAGRRRARPAAPSRANIRSPSPRDGERPRLQQRRADGQARHGRSRRQAGARRLFELPVRPREGRRRAGDRPVRQHVPDAESSAERTC